MFFCDGGMRECESPKPLPAPVERPALDSATVAQWERLCGGQTERRQSLGGEVKQ
jgi:hypothetical protein